MSHQKSGCLDWETTESKVKQLRPMTEHVHQNPRLIYYRWIFLLRYIGKRGTQKQRVSGRSKELRSRHTLTFLAAPPSQALRRNRKSYGTCGQIPYRERYCVQNNQNLGEGKENIAEHCRKQFYVGEFELRFEGTDLSWISGDVEDLMLLRSDEATNKLFYDATVY